jgi:hypothetical protein
MGSREMLVNCTAENRRALWAPLIAVSCIIALNFLIRFFLEDADKKIVSFLGNYYGDKLNLIFQQSPWWTLLLPNEALTGVWSTTGHILVYSVERIIGSPNLFFVLNALTILVAFYCGWIASRSLTFSCTLALCLGLGTWNHHTYSVPGGMIMYLMMMYMLANLLSIYSLLRGTRYPQRWNAVFVVSLLAMAMAYEQWLDYWVVMLVWGAILIAFARGADYACNLARLKFVAVSGVVIGMAYLAIRIPYHTSIGMENDTVHTYSNIIPAVEDVVSNIIMHIYMAVTTLLPFTGMSMSLQELGPDSLIQQQHGYHAAKSNLVPMHYLFWWRYVAGAVFVGYVYALWRVWTTTRRERTLQWLMALLFVLMIGLGHATHDAIKFRPMNSAPVLTYHLLVAVLGVSLLVSFGLTALRADLHSKLRSTVLIYAAWGIILLAALVRPGMMSYYSNYVGIGTYPDPVRKLQTLVERLR